MIKRGEKKVRTNSNYVKRKIRNHIYNNIRARDYGVRTKKDALKKQINYMRFPGESDYQCAKRFVTDGNFLISDWDIKRFINSLGINKERKKYDRQKTFDLYRHLIAREISQMMSE